MGSAGQLTGKGVQGPYLLLHLIWQTGKVVGKGVQLDGKVGKVTGEDFQVVGKVGPVTCKLGQRMCKALQALEQGIHYFPGSSIVLNAFEKHQAEVAK